MVTKNERVKLPGHGRGGLAEWVEFYPEGAIMLSDGCDTVYLYADQFKQLRDAIRERYPESVTNAQEHTLQADGQILAGQQDSTEDLLLDAQPDSRRRALEKTLDDLVADAQQQGLRIRIDFRAL